MQLKLVGTNMIKTITGVITFKYRSSIFRRMGVSLEEYIEYYHNKMEFKYYKFSTGSNLKGVHKFKEILGKEKVGLLIYIIWLQLGKFANLSLRGEIRLR